MGEKYLQIHIPDKGLVSIKIKNSCNSATKTTQFKNGQRGTSLVAQWLRIHLPIQGTRVQALVREDPTYHGATKPMHHNY